MISYLKQKNPPLTEVYKPRAGDLISLCQRRFICQGIICIKKRKSDFSASIKELLEATKNGPRTVTPPDRAGRFAAHIGPSTRHRTTK
ncbi:MAG: hypothetical protein A3E37_01015 [Candidatus Andersenbacteria bacterium RIFCSPHIGHO2_12_FULL_46_9]|nr:MAG: hypothetical protein A3B76_04160 [Candidatus Andersenbacteria bacterium RIFCSPHIGHO2_02_FULL_46_16]OGY37692.1 MAG: hypothetical protein A3E37_01015 [Candidatus Andersenbacteria bacterium RIFCSPHIGHO2_12_FULL_46_9]OGY38282.1 MAG: hypothetical protein A3I08_03350 [Candidatus Andersenbacteria bacterium RIFCSPLOWO2_02_FULL_46_11]